MYGGTISGNTTTDIASGGSGVFINGNGGGATFRMTGGTISGNTATSDGGGVYLLGPVTFTMSGGTIRDNKAGRWGGGVLISSGTFTMSDGTISGNTAGTGGGVHSYESFTKTGGTIYGDTDRIHTAGSTENTATANDSHAAYIVMGSIYRSATLDIGDNVNASTIAGWEKLNQ
jgi:hypothetical protein